MSLDVRQAILQNMKGNTQEDFKNIIVDAISSGEEKMLPGLGVLFEMVWKNADESGKTQVLSTLVTAAK